MDGGLKPNWLLKITAIFGVSFSPFLLSLSFIYQRPLTSLPKQRLTSYSLLAKFDQAPVFFLSTVMIIIIINSSSSSSSSSSSKVITTGIVYGYFFPTAAELNSCNWWTSSLKYFFQILYRKKSADPCLKS